VEEIVKILRSISQNGRNVCGYLRIRIGFRVGGFEMRLLAYLRIQSRQPEITPFRFSTESDFVFGRRSPQGRGAFEQIKHVIRRSIRKPAFLYTGGGWALVTFGGGLLVSTTSFIQASSQSRILVWYNHVEKERAGIAIPKYRREAPTFWDRDSDKIILDVISALIGAMITLLVNRFRQTRPKHLQNP